MSASPEDIARVKWNRSADMHNQWETLDAAEKRELIARESPPIVTMHVEAMESGKTIIGGRCAGKTEAMRIMMARGATNLLPENPTRFDYLHAIRAVASRSGADEIYNLADAAMQLGDAARPTQDAKRMGDVTICRNGYVEDLERQLSESESELDFRRQLYDLHRDEIDKLRDKLAKADHEIQRLRAAVDESNIAELHRQLSERTSECEEQARLLGMCGEREARLIAERDRLVEVLKRIGWINGHGIPKHNPEAVIARSALAAVKGGSHE